MRDPFTRQRFLELLRSDSVVGAQASKNVVEPLRGRPLQPHKRLRRGKTTPGRVGQQSDRGARSAVGGRGQGKSGGPVGHGV